jgi:hypothetical protein
MFSSSRFLKVVSKRALNTSATRNVVTIKSLKAREIIDSRGNPTVEVDVHTTAGNYRGIFIFRHKLNITRFVSISTRSKMI